MSSYNKSKKRKGLSPFESSESDNLPKKLIKNTLQQTVKGTQDLGADFGRDFLNEILGTNLTPDAQQPGPDIAAPQLAREPAAEQTSSHEIFSMQKIDKAQKFTENKPAKQKSKSESLRQPAMPYFNEYSESIRRFDSKSMNREDNEQNRQIRQIMEDLKKLVASTNVLKTQFGQISVETAPLNPGKYYVSFFEWLSIMIRQARQKVEDSKAWLETLQGKSKKLGYWGKAKKHGTSFSQANERNVATSTG